MKTKIILLVVVCALGSGCQRAHKLDYEYGYVSPTGFAGNNPYWSNNYRLNSSNYLGNMSMPRYGGKYNSVWFSGS